MPATTHRPAARGTEYPLYARLLVPPVLGWATVSASGVAVLLVGRLDLPGITAVDAGRYAELHQARVIAAYLLLLTFLGHLCGPLLQAFVLRDGVFSRMTGRWEKAVAPAPH